MRSQLRAALSNNSPTIRNPTEQDVLGFFGQFFATTSGSLPAAQQAAMNDLCRLQLSPNQYNPALANPSLADVTAFFSQLQTDANGTSALSAQQYLNMLDALRGALTSNPLGSVNPSIADLSKYFAPYAQKLLNVATRCAFNYTVAGASSTTQLRTFHIAQDNISTIQVDYQNALLSGGLVEVGTGGALGISCGVEYPLNTTTTPLLWSGSANGSIPNLSTLRSDALTLPTMIPKGAKFALRPFVTYGAGGMPFSGQQANGLGDQINFGGATNQSAATGNISNNQSVTFLPSAIVGMTSNVVLGLLGDSITFGLGDQANATTGDNGIFARLYGPLYAYVKSGCPGDGVNAFLASHAIRLAMLKNNCNTILCNYGINDMNGGFTAAQVQANLITLRALFPGLRFYQATYAPFTTGAWTAVDGSDQTVAASAATSRPLMNAWVKANTGGFDGFIDVNQYFESGTTAKWNANGTVGKYTGDGTHPTTFATQLEAAPPLPLF